MKMNFFPYCLLFCVALIFAELACAAPEILEQRVKSSFQPSTSFLLWSPSKGRVVSHQAIVISSLSQPQEYVVGTEGISDKSKLGPAPYCFFLKGKDASFAATPVRLNTAEASSPSLTEIESENAELQLKQIQLRNNLNELKKKLVDLRGRAMLVGGVDSIILLQTEINRIKNGDIRRDNEQARLKELIAVGRKEQDSTGLDELRQLLSGALRDTAQATALADRLKSRKKQAAKQSLDDQLQMIRETSNINREEIAREILSLRAKRKQLEAQLKVRDAL
jgi:hypothetical protein